MQLYSKIEGNNISNPVKLLRLLKNTLNPEKLSESELNQKNIYVYNPPEFDSLTHKTGNLIYDTENNYVTREIVARDFDIQVEKDRKIKQVKQYIETLLDSTDKYYIRQLHRGISVPSHIEQERDFICNESDRMKSEIQGLMDIRSILTYDFKINNLQYHNIKSY